MEDFIRCTYSKPHMNECSREGREMGDGKKQCVEELSVAREWGDVCVS